MYLHHESAWFRSCCLTIWTPFLISCLHKPVTTVLLSLSTFPSSPPNSLPNEKGTSNTSLCPQWPTLTDLTTDVSGLDHRRVKNGFVDTLALAFWDNKRQRYIRDGKKGFAPSVSGPNNLIKNRNRKGACWFCHRRAKFDSQQSFWE